MPSAFDPPDVQVGVEPDIFLSKASLPADCFQPIHYLFHQNLITPLPFHNANFRNYALNFYYTLVAYKRSAPFRSSIAGRPGTHTRSHHNRAVSEYQDKKNPPAKTASHPKTIGVTVKRFPSQATITPPSGHNTDSSENIRFRMAGTVRAVTTRADNKSILQKIME